MKITRLETFVVGNPWKNWVFVKVHTHGTQERNAQVLLGGGLKNVFSWVREESMRRGCDCYFVTAWQMYQAIDAIRREADPVAAVEVADSAMVF